MWLDDGVTWFSVWNTIHFSIPQMSIYCLNFILSKNISPNNIKEPACQHPCPCWPLRCTNSLGLVVSRGTSLTGVFLRWTHRKNVIRIHSWSSCGLGAAFGDFWPIAIVGKQNATKADGSGAKEWLPPAVIPPQLMHLQELLLAAWSWDPGIPVALGWPILLLFGGRKWSNDPVDVGQGNQADTSNS